METAIAEPMSLASIAQVLGGLLVVLLVLGLCALLLKRMTALSGGGGGRLLKVVETLPLSPRDRLVLLEIDGRRLLVGISPGRISALADLGAAAGGFDAALSRSVQELKVAGS